MQIPESKHPRKYKYNKKIIQHWVETAWTGKLSDKYKEEEKEEVEATGEHVKGSLVFDDGAPEAGDEDGDELIQEACHILCSGVCGEVFGLLLCLLRNKRGGGC